jgi:hypothetical protein
MEANLKELESAWDNAKSKTHTLPFIKPGVFELTVESCKLIQSTKKRATFFVAEFTVDKSTNPEFETGSNVSFMVNLSNDFVVADAKEFVATCMSAPFDSTTAQVLASVTNPNTNPLKGTRLHCVAIDKPSKTTGKLYTRCTWRLMDLAPGLKNTGKKVA